MRILSPRLRAQIIKEFLSILRDPRARAILLGPPIMQLLIFSLAATLEVKNASIAIYDRDNGVWSQELVDRVAASAFVGRIFPVYSPTQLGDAIDQRNALLAIDIPETFSRDMAAGHPAALQVIVDGRRANSGQMALSYLESLAAHLGPPVRLLNANENEFVSVRHWFNRNLIYRWFIVPGLAVQLAMISALIITALSIARERELGTFDQLMVSPTTPAEIIIAKVVPALVIGTLLGLLMVGAGVFIFGVPFTGSLGWLVLAMLTFILSIVGIGLMISAVCATQQQAFIGCFAATVPMILMSGFTTPVENMPMVLQWIAEAIPLKHALTIVHGTFLKAWPPSYVAGEMLPLALIALVTLTAATRLVRSRLQ